MPYKPYFGISFDDGTYGIWNKANSTIFDKVGDKLRVEIIYQDDAFQGTVILEDSLSKVREFFNLNKIVSEVECIDIEESGNKNNMH